MNLDDIDLQVCEEKDKSIIANLLQFYCYDIMQQSKLANYSFNKKGLFEKIPFFDNYWNEDNCFPYLITSTQKPIGFALVHNKTISNKANWKIAELFILSFYRNSNIGRHVMNYLFKRFSGLWEISILKDNVPAQKFWSKILGVNAKEIHYVKYPQYLVYEKLI